MSRMSNGRSQKNDASAHIATASQPAHSLPPPPIESRGWEIRGQVSDNSAVQTVAINSNPFTIGRHSENALRLFYPTVSGHHAEIVAGADSLFLRDLNSTNGTFVNGRRLIMDIPIRDGDYIQFANALFQIARSRFQNTTATVSEEIQDQALALLQFDRLMMERSVVPHFQPIMTVGSEQLIGFELLGRSRVFGLYTPKAMFHAASQFDLEQELSRLLRIEGMHAAERLPQHCRLFLNTHPRELGTPELTESLASIRKNWPDRLLTLEIHEAAVTGHGSLEELKAVLNDLDIQLAYDDFGAGQARLVELAEVRPDFLKFDIGLIRDIHVALKQRHQLVRTLVDMTKELGILSLAEGVEKLPEYETCIELGFDLVQGFYCGKPAPVTTWSNA